MRVVKTIVNDRRELIGFVVEGRDLDLGGFTTATVQKPIPLHVLRENGFSNRQIDVMARGIKEKGKFRLNELPMMVLVDNKLVPVDNSMTLTHRFIQNNEVVGFTIGFGDGSKANYTYQNTMRLSFWFKPTNFIVSRSANKKHYIYGKPGVLKLEELPTTDLSKRVSKGNSGGQKRQEHNTKKKRIKPAAQPVQKTGKFVNVVDIIDIYDTLRKCDGLVIHLPDEEYKAASGSGYTAADEFVPLGVGEYAPPVLMFNKTKLNANASFRKPGTVNVDFNGMKTPVQTFTYNTKSIFLGGENYIKRFGVAIPEELAEEFMNNFGKSMGVRPIEDNKLIQAVTSLSGKDGLDYFEIDTSKIDLITPNKFNTYRLSAKDIYNIVGASFPSRLIEKFLSPTHGLLKELKAEFKGDYQKTIGKKPIGLYAGMGEEFRRIIQEAGINIYSGSFNKRNQIGGGGGGGSNNKAIEIDYTVRGRDADNWSYRKIRKTWEDGGNLPKEVKETIDYIAGIKDEEHRIAEAHRIHKEHFNKTELVKKKLWLHKCVMYLEGDKKKVHVHDKDKWELDTKSRARTFTPYECVEPGCEGLRIKLTNTRI